METRALYVDISSRVGMNLDATEAEQSHVIMHVTQYRLLFDILITTRHIMIGTVYTA